MYSTELLLCHPNGPFQLNVHQLSFLASPTGTQIKRRVVKGVHLHLSSEVEDD